MKHLVSIKRPPIKRPLSNAPYQTPPLELLRFIKRPGRLLNHLGYGPSCNINIPNLKSIF